MNTKGIKLEHSTIHLRTPSRTICVSRRHGDSVRGHRNIESTGTGHCIVVGDRGVIGIRDSNGINIGLRDRIDTSKMSSIVVGHDDGIMVRYGHRVILCGCDGNWARDCSGIVLRD